MSSITEGIPAVDHHSHASAYVSASGRYRTVADHEAHFATGHLESRVPSSVYQRYVRARNSGDATTLAHLESEHGIEKLVAEGKSFRSTTFFTRALEVGCELMYGTDTASGHAVAGDALRSVSVSAPYDRALEIAETPVVLADVRSIDRSVWDAEKYRQVIRVDPYLYPFGVGGTVDRGTERERFEGIFATVLSEELHDQQRDSVPLTLSEFDDFVMESLRRRRAVGAIGYKFASAYVRSLEFGRVDKGLAADEYGRLVRGQGGDRRAIADYMATRIAINAAEHSVPLQIHTGMGHPEPGMYIRNADPLNLESFLLQPALNRTQIILIHGSYPFTSKAAALAQTYGNVYLDFSWMPYLHHAHLRQKLIEWMEILPANKVIFGSDTGLPEFHVAASHFTREALDFALSDGVTRGVWTATQCDFLAQRILFQNAADLYAL